LVGGMGRVKNTTMSRLIGNRTKSVLKEGRGVLSGENFLKNKS